MVFSILVEAGKDPDSSEFTESDIFKQCRKLGIIPESEDSLDSTENLTHEKTEISVQDQAENTLQYNFKISNMWCPSCAWIVEHALKKSPGIVDASCNFSSDMGKVFYNPITTSPDKISEIIRNLGYFASAGDGELNKAIKQKEFLRLSITVFLTMNVMMLSWALYSGFFSEIPESAVKRISWPIFVLASVVFFYGGKPLFKKAVAGFTISPPGMESLVATGASCAFFYSTFNLIRGDIHLYFDTSSMLIVLVLLGKILERSARDKLLEDFSGIFALKPEKVRICTESKPEGSYVSSSGLTEGDLFRVIEGEIIPADGQVEKGTATVDKSSITGEPVPVNLKSGDTVQSGCRVNEGMLYIRAEKTGESSVLGRVISILEKNLTDKSESSARSERYLLYFVPGIITLAISTGLYCIFSGLSAGEAIERSVTVMVISCPCALGIAIPLAHVAGISAAGKMGILVRNVDSFSQVEKIDSFVFDKTGTITTGNLELVDFYNREFTDKRELLSVAEGLESENRHYIATSIKNYCASANIKGYSFSRIVTHDGGLTGESGNFTACIGNRNFVEEISDSNFDDFFSDKSDPPSIYSLVYLSINKEPAAVISFGDTLRAGIKSLVKHLNNSGCSVFIISGDSKTAVKKVAKRVGVEVAKGEMLPEDKSRFVENLKQRGKDVAMVGDGINDAPAMTSANLSVAVQSGFAPGVEVADVTLLKGEPLQLYDFLELSKKVNSKVKQNLLFAVIYNFISIPVAMAGLLSPVIAATAMLLSSLSVTLNTLRLAKKSNTYSTTKLKTNPETA